MNAGVDVRRHELWHLASRRRASVLSEMRADAPTTCRQYCSFEYISYGLSDTIKSENGYFLLPKGTGA